MRATGFLGSRTFHGLLVGLVATAAVLFALERWVALPLSITTPSMEPALRNGDRILVRRDHDSVDQLRDSIDRGDVIVFRAPQKGDPLVVKRVIGMPGETLEAKDGVIALENETILEEEWLPESARELGSKGANSVDIERVLLEEDEVFVMGDNRAASIDSRSFGPVSLDRVVGRKAWRIWPPSRWGTLDWS